MPPPRFETDTSCCRLPLEIDFLMKGLEVDTGYIGTSLIKSIVTQKMLLVLLYVYSAFINHTANVLEPPDETVIVVRSKNFLACT